MWPPTSNEMLRPDSWPSWHRDEVSFTLGGICERHAQTEPVRAGGPGRRPKLRTPRTSCSGCHEDSRAAAPGRGMSALVLRHSGLCARFAASSLGCWQLACSLQASASSPTDCSLSSTRPARPSTSALWRRWRGWRVLGSVRSLGSRHPSRPTCARCAPGLGATPPPSRVPLSPRPSRPGRRR